MEPSSFAAGLARSLSVQMFLIHTFREFYFALSHFRAGHREIQKSEVIHLKSQGEQLCV